MTLLKQKQIVLNVRVLAPAAALLLLFLLPASLYSSGNFLPRYLVDDIDFNFKTTRSFDKAQLREVMYLPKTRDFNQDELEKDRQRLKKFYFDNGFFDAIVDTSVTYDNANGEVDIEILIIENTRYEIKELRFRGLEDIVGKLSQEIGTDRIVNRGDYYSKSAISKECTRVIELLMNNGYLNAHLDTSSRTEVAKYSEDVQKNPDYAHKVRVTVTFAGVEKKYYFGTTKIDIQDNKYRLETGIVERELKYKEGDLFSRDLMVQSERNLTKLALIQIGRVQIDTVIENESRVNLVVNIVLNKKYQITPGIVGKFIDNYFYLGAGLQYDDKNFIGGGRVLSVKIEPLYHSKDVNKVELSASLFQPYLFSDNITANYNISLQFKNFNEIFQYLILSNTLTLNYLLPKYTFYNNLSLMLNADLVRLKIKQTYIDAETQDTTYEGSLINLMNSPLSFTATHSSTNNVFNPSSGFYHSITLEEAGMLPALLNKISNNVLYSQYFKFLLLNYFYFDLTTGLGSRVFAVANRMGWIAEFGKDENIIPIASQYKFFSGGGNSVRGWKAQDNGMLENTQSGGKFLFEGSFEYRWMLFPENTNFMKDIGTVFFLDYGNVWESGRQFKLSENALAIGFGLRYYTFIGPVRIDVGFKLYDPKATDGRKWLTRYNFKEIFSDRLAFQFGLGNAF